MVCALLVSSALIIHGKSICLEMSSLINMRTNSFAPFPLWVVLSYSVFLAILIPVYWVYYGPQNFLWGCDIALMMTLYALWRRSALLASMAVLVTLIPDILWIADFAVQLISGRDVLSIGATAYMFDHDTPVFVRALSLFHIFLAPLLLWMIYHIGYDHRALYWQTGIAWVVLPLSYLFTDPEKNINWVHGIGSLPPAWMPPVVFVLVIMLVVPAFIFWTTHWLMQRLFPGANTIKQM